MTEDYFERLMKPHVHPEVPATVICCSQIALQEFPKQFVLVPLANLPERQVYYLFVGVFSIGRPGHDVLIIFFDICNPFVCFKIVHFARSLMLAIACYVACISRPSN